MGLSQRRQDCKFCGEQIVFLVDLWGKGTKVIDAEGWSTGETVYDKNVHTVHRCVALEKRSAKEDFS